jgi:hypothetical protein
MRRNEEKSAKIFEIKKAAIVYSGFIREEQGFSKGYSGLALSIKPTILSVTFRTSVLKSKPFAETPTV